MDRTFSIAVVAACPFPQPRGTPIRVLRMAESLAARGHHVEVITYHIGQHLAELPFPVHRIPAVPTYHRTAPGPTYQKLFVLDPLLSCKVAAVVRSRPFDVIHAHHYEGLLAALPSARRFRIPVVFDVHTLLGSELPHYKLGLPRGLLHLVGETLDRLLPRQANHVVAVTRAIRSRMMDEIGIPADRVTTVYTGAEMEHFLPSADQEPPSSTRTLIYTGTLEAYQRIDLMLRAFREVLNQAPDVRLKIVTDGSIESYQPLIRQLDLGDSLEVIKARYFELPMQLHSAMIALSPRVLCDGLPAKVLNYMATGRAIVAFEGSAEALENGQTAVVTSNGNVQEFSAAILSLLASPAKARELGRNARAHVEEFFVWEAAAQALERIYGRLIDRGAAR